MPLQTEHNFIADVRLIVEQAKHKTYQAINNAMVEAYWLIGKRIVEQEQQGAQRAGYGKEILKELSNALGTGFSARNLRDFRQFYLTFPNDEIWRTLCAKLNWSHIRLIMRVSEKNAQSYYLKEASTNNWSVRTLDRNIATLYYQRLVSSQLKEPVEAEMLEQTKSLQNDKYEFIKNPFVLEFLNLPNNFAYTEVKLEQTLLNNIQQFLLELGKGFAFVARQKLIRTETSDFYIDLVFYNYILKCFVLVNHKGIFR